MEFWVILYGGTICCCNTSVNSENSVFVYYNEDDTSIWRQRLRAGLIKRLYFSPWKCQGSWPARSAAALERLPLAHRCPGCPSALCKFEEIETIIIRCHAKKIPAQFCCPTLTCALWRPGWGYGLTGMPDSHLDNPRGRKRPLRSSHCIRGS